MALDDFVIRDDNGVPLQVFAPKEGSTLVSPYTPTEDEIVQLATNVTITIDGIAADYISGSVIGLREDVVYTLSATTAVHRM